MKGCIVVNKDGIDKLMLKYLGENGGHLTNDEREILLMALYMESEANGGIAARALAIMNGRLVAQQAKIAVSLQATEEPCK